MRHHIQSIQFLYKDQPERIHQDRETGEEYDFNEQSYMAHNEHLAKQNQARGQEYYPLWELNQFMQRSEDWTIIDTYSSEEMEKFISGVSFLITTASEILLQNTAEAFISLVEHLNHIGYGSQALKLITEYPTSLLMEP